jgi:hypothetical protein
VDPARFQKMPLHNGVSFCHVSEHRVLLTGTTPRLGGISDAEAGKRQKFLPSLLHTRIPVVCALSCAFWSVYELGQTLSHQSTHVKSVSRTKAGDCVPHAGYRVVSQHEKPMSPNVGQDFFPLIRLEKPVAEPTKPGVVRFTNNMEHVF